MMARHMFLVTLVVATCVHMGSACSCLLSHPQTQVCQADFVIVARVKKVFHPNEMSTVYKVRIKKEFKMSAKASLVLKSGRLVSAGYSSMCGVDLKPEETYLVTGRVVAGRARISLCSFIEPWNTLTVRQKKGFRLLYRQGCQCQIVDCPWWRKCNQHNATNECVWVTSFNSDSSLPDCQLKHAVCMKTPKGTCAWSADNKYRECMKMRRRIRDEKLSNEP